MLTDNGLDIDQFLNTDLFAQAQTSPQSASSSPSSPEQGLLTPPQPVPPPAFHDASDGLVPSFLYDDDLKLIDPLTPSPFDFLGVGSSALDHTMSGYMDLGYNPLAGLSMSMGIDMGLNMPIANIQDDALAQMAIDPQLVDTPASTAPISDFDDEDGAQEGDDEQSSQVSSAGTSPAASGHASTSRSTPAPTAESEKEHERLTLTIAPIKVGGHGKARRGTVQSGGVVKKTGVSLLHRDKENTIASAVFSSGAHSAALASLPSPGPTSLPSPDTAESPTSKGFPNPPAILKAAPSKKGKAKNIEEDDDDDVPQDWRPSPEVFARMTSKEKRQLRNKISARNFRVRRKEYISTLEGDIAERDRLLEAIRSELGTTQSENLALRQEVASLKKVLLEGRGAADLPSLNLPPPAPMPVGLPISAAASVSATTATITSEGIAPSPPTTPSPHQQANATASTNATNPFALNTQKDLPSSPMPRNAGGFWGGQHQPFMAGMGGGAGGITPVHTALVPEVNVGLWGFSGKKVLGDSVGANANINPLMNAVGAGVGLGGGKAMVVERREEGRERERLSAFDAFADTNMFTMKNLDAYRMQLWGKMAAQHHAHQNFLAQQQQQQQQQQQPQQHQSQLTGHAAGLRPAYLSSHALSPKGSIASSNSSLGGTLAALLSGKHTPSSSNSGLLTPPASPRLGAQSARPSSSSVATQKEREREREREAQAAVLAVVASQTLFKKLGNAFWDAFSGSSSSASPSSSSSSSSGSTRNWDADKVRRVLEGKAVVKVVDVEPAVVSVVPSIVVSPAVSVPASVASVGVQTGGGAPSTSASTREVQQQCGVHKKCEEMKGCVSEILEESMRSLTLGHKGGAPARRL